MTYTNFFYKIERDNFNARNHAQACYSIPRSYRLPVHWLSADLLDSRIFDDWATRILLLRIQTSRISIVYSAQNPYY